MNNETPAGQPFRLEIAAAKLCVSVKTVRRLIRDHALTAYKTRGRWFLRDSDLKNYEAKQRSLQGS
jgi:excisionase family DNA binding protein